MAKAKKSAAKTQETQATVAPEAAAQTTTSLEPVQLTIADLQLLARIIDLASRRGAFQANELSQVGDAYNKLSGFLSYVESVQASESTEASATPTSQPEAANPSALEVNEPAQEEKQEATVIGSTAE